MATTNHPPSLRETWNEFKTALYAPAYQDFNALYWVYRLSHALSNFLLRRVVPWVRPIIPFFGMALTATCVCSYFSTFRETIIKHRWCGCDKDDKYCQSCHWDTIHTLSVVFFATNIIIHYLRCAFQSPGYVINEVDSSNKTDDEKYHQIEMRFGGCCFLSSKINAKAERERCLKYNQLCTVAQNESTLNQTTIYHPSPHPTHCGKCQHERPPRSHHCRVCNACILEFDHHCPWVNNCIGYNNYREFLLLVFYITLGCTYGCCILGYDFIVIMLKRVELHGFKIMGAVHGTGLLDLPPPWTLWRQYHAEGKIDDDIVLRTAFPFMLFISVAMMFILVPQMKLLIAGYTTVEHRSRPGENFIVDAKENKPSAARCTAAQCIVKNPFDHGPKNNAERIFGTSLLGLILPLPFHPDPLLHQTHVQTRKDR
ncbi:hypothetical protein ACHAXR_011685 [Thalassiosira sp. AJA248-18]